MKTCLIVDDSRMIRRVAGRIVKDLGFETVEAVNGQDALDKCNMEMPQAILVDWAMPIMDGFDFVKQLRELPDGDKPTVVFCTSVRDIERIVQALAAGADEYHRIKICIGRPSMSAPARGALSLEPSYYDALHRLTLELAGINLGSNHAFLVETRLSRLAREEGYDSLDMMIDELFKTGGSRLAVQVVSALTERETQFFKDKTAFERLREHVLPDLHHKRGGGRIRVLSFGCSSGQEAYGIAMTVHEMRDQLDGLKVDILGVDYPSQALERARTGTRHLRRFSCRYVLR